MEELFLLAMLQSLFGEKEEETVTIDREIDGQVYHLIFNKKCI